MAAQLADAILFEGNKLDLYSNPLEEYWLKSKKKRPAFTTSEDCRRGYIAHWEIRDNQLLLTNVDGIISKRGLFGRKPVNCTMKMLFSKPGQNGVKADWFSGKLRIPKGNMTQYEHSGYNSRFEREMIITVDKGNILKIRTLDYTQKTLTVG